MSAIMPLRTKGSPPVNRSFLTPFSMKTVQTLSNSSMVSKFFFGRNVMSSAMQ